MTGKNTNSNIYQKDENAWQLLQLIQSQKLTWSGKSEKYKVSEQENDNSGYVILNDMTQTLKVCMFTGTFPKRHGLQQSASATKKKPTAVSQ